MTLPLFTFTSEVTNRNFRVYRLLIFFASVASVVIAALLLFSAPAKHEARLKAAKLTELDEIVRGNPQDARALFYQGKQLYALGRFDAALQSLSKAADASPNDVTIWIAAAECAEKRDGTAGASEIIQKYLQKHPKDTTATIFLARIYLKELRIDEAKATLEAVLIDSTRDANAWRTLGEIQLARNDSIAAQSAMKKALALDPKDWRNQLGMGDALAVGKNDAGAIPYYQNAIGLAPQEGLPYLRFGRSLLQSSPNIAHLAESHEALETARKYLGDEPQISLYEGIAFLREQRWIEAKDTLEHYREQEPTSDTVHYQLARVYRALGETEAEERSLTRHRAVELFLHNKLALLSRIHSAEQANASRDVWKLRWKLAQGFVENGEYIAGFDQYLRLQAMTDVAPESRVQIQREFDALLKQPTIAQLRFRTMSLSEVLTAGTKLLEGRRWAEAEAAFQTVINRDSKNAFAWEGLGLARIGNSKIKTAAKPLVIAVTMDKTRTKALLALGEIYRASGVLTEAQKAFTAAIQQQPANGDGWYRLGGTLQQIAKSPQDTIHAFSMAVTCDPQNISYQLDLADVLASDNQMKEAEKVFRNALMKSPGSSEVLSRVGGFFAKISKTSEAETMLSKALKIDPNDDYAHFQLGKIALANHHAEIAIRHFETAIKQRPKELEIWYALSRAYQASGRKVEAADAVRQGARLQKDYIDYIQAKEQVALKPDDVMRNLAAARLAAQQGNIEESISYYESVLRLEPQNRDALRERVKQLQKKEKAEK